MENNIDLQFHQQLQDKNLQIETLQKEIHNLYKYITTLEQQWIQHEALAVSGQYW